MFEIVHHGGAGFGKAGHGGVACNSVINGLNGGLTNIFRCVKIRLADGETEYIFALGAQLLSQGADAEGCGGLEVEHTFG